MLNRYFILGGTWGDSLDFPHFNIKITEYQRDILELHSYFLESSSVRNTTIAPLLQTDVNIVELEGIPFLRTPKHKRIQDSAHWYPR